MSPPWLALGVAATLVGGVVVHELAHAVAAALVADDWAINWAEPATYAEYQDGATWRPRLVAVAPLLAGLAWLTGLLVGAGLPTDAWAGLPWLGGAVMVVGGGLDEFRFEEDTATDAAEPADD